LLCVPLHVRCWRRPVEPGPAQAPTKDLKPKGPLRHGGRGIALRSQSDSAQNKKGICLFSPPD
jgi:hypothetical protein